MDSHRIKERIRENSAEIVRLHSRIHETVKHRTKTPEKRREWEQACSEFHARYEGLAFPGGYRDGQILLRLVFGHSFIKDTLSMIAPCVKRKLS
jgi:hypothetical protein